MPAIDLSILNQRQTPAFYADVFANRPAAGFVGRIFVSTNTFAFYRDNGTSWDLIGGPGTGTITGSGISGQIALWDGASTITGDTGLTYNGTDNSLTASKFIVTSGTSSQFLKGDGSLDNNTYNTGSGAASQVAFFSGTNAITGENNLWWDSVNNHFGINTNVPGTAADIHHDQSTILQLNQTVATNDTRIAFQNSGAALWRIGNFYNAGANDFGIYDAVAAIQPITVKKTTGQVLIGTSTVGSGKLVVASTTGDNGIQIVGATAPSLRIDSAESGPTKRIGLGISTAVNNFIQGSVDRDMCIFNGSTTASPILFGIYDTTNVQEAARISAARNFLIGTTTDAGQKLQVNGAAYVVGNLGVGTSDTSTYRVNINNTMNVNGSTFLASGTGGVVIGDTTAPIGTLDIKANSPVQYFQAKVSVTSGSRGDIGWLNSLGNGTATIRALAVSSDVQATSLQFLTRDTTGSQVERLTIAQDGTKYFGNQTGSRFQMSASGENFYQYTNTYYIYGMYNSSNNLAIESAFSGDIEFRAQNQTISSVPQTATIRATIKGNTGNFLIGTTTDAGQKLQVNGTALLSASINGGQGAFLTFDNTFGGANDYGIVCPALNDLAIRNISNGYNAIYIQNETTCADIGFNGMDRGGGEGIIFIANRVVAPSSNPTGGGILYVEAGALKYRGSSGTVTTIANA